VDEIDDLYHVATERHLQDGLLTRALQRGVKAGTADQPSDSISVKHESPASGVPQ
jgi:hypothetical protein